MHNSSEEQYVFLPTADGDIREALSFLGAWSLEQKPLIQYAILRSAVIAYMRPFTYCQTVFEHVQRDGKPRKRLTLRTGVVPDGMKTLHAMLEEYRDGAYAHTDLSKRNPRLYYQRSGPWEFPIALAPVDRYPLYIRVDPMRALFEAFRKNLLAQISDMEIDLRKTPPLSPNAMDESGSP
jgi:hypothetical protein